MTIAADTTAVIEALVASRYRAMTPRERIIAASSMSESARQIVRASLPAGLSRQDLRLALARRIYGFELPDAALHAHAVYRAP